MRREGATQAKWWAVQKQLSYSALYCTVQGRGVLEERIGFFARVSYSYLCTAHIPYIQRISNTLINIDAVVVVHIRIVM